MEFPITPEYALEILKPGKVIRWADPSIPANNGEVPHFYFVLNTPKNLEESVLLAVHTTSKGKKFKKDRNLKDDFKPCYFEVGEDYYEHFDKKSFFDFSHVVKIEVEEFVQGIRTGDMKLIKPDLEKEKIEDLQHKISECTLVEDEIRYLIDRYF